MGKRNGEMVNDMGKKRICTFHLQSCQTRPERFLVFGRVLALGPQGYFDQLLTICIRREINENMRFAFFHLQCDFYIVIFLINLA